MTRKRHPNSEKKGKGSSISRRTLGFFIVLGIIVITIASGWYLLQQSKRTLATDFSLTDLEGNSFRLNDFRGKIILIDFMATWCVPCRREMPHYGEVWEKYGDEIVLMSIDIDPRESEDDLRSFVQEFPYASWIWAKDTVNLAQVYDVSSIPKTVIIDQDGYIQFTHVGLTDASTFTGEIERLLG